MLVTFCPLTIWAIYREFSRNRLKLSADTMHRACELKDRIYKKTRTLHFSEITLTARVILKEEEMTSLVGKRQFGRHFRSKIVSRQWGDNFCRETSRCLAGPCGKGSSEELFR